MALAAAGGLAAGLGAWCKVTSLSFAMATVILLLLGAIMRQWTRRNACLCGLAFSLVAGGSIGLLLARNHANYGAFVVSQETIRNTQRGTDLHSLLRTVGQIQWPKYVESWWYRDALWWGGWSFIPPARPLQTLYTWLVRGTLLGGAVFWLLAGRRLKSDRRYSFSLLACILFFGVTTLGLAWHAIQSYVARGIVTTNPWYAAAGFPFFFALMLLAAKALPWRHGLLAITVTLSTVFVSVEMYGALWQMPHEYGQSGWWQSVCRVGSLQPTGFGATTLLLAAVATLLVWAVTVAVFVKQGVALRS